MNAPFAKVTVVGADVFIRQTEMPNFKAGADFGSFELTFITNRGTKVWPGPLPKINMTDVYRCRFMCKRDAKVDVLGLLQRLETLGFEWVHVEKLHEIDGRQGYSAVSSG